MLSSSWRHYYVACSKQVDSMGLCPFSWYFSLPHFLPPFSCFPGNKPVCNKLLAPAWCGKWQWAEFENTSLRSGNTSLCWKIHLCGRDLHENHISPFSSFLFALTIHQAWRGHERNNELWEQGLSPAQTFNFWKSSHFLAWSKPTTTLLKNAGCKNPRYPALSFYSKSQKSDIKIALTSILCHWQAKMKNRREIQYSYVENNFELHRSSWLNCALRGDEAEYWVSNTDSV